MENADNTPSDRASAAPAGEPIPPATDVEEWRDIWFGSHPDRGRWIAKKTGERIAWLGESEHANNAAANIVGAHNAEVQRIADQRDIALTEATISKALAEFAPPCDAGQRLLLRQALDALTAATSFTSKKARDQAPALITALRAAISESEGSSK